LPIFEADLIDQPQPERRRLDAPKLFVVVHMPPLRVTGLPSGVQVRDVKSTLYSSW
jgi:hypothetical protein